MGHLLTIADLRDPTKFQTKEGIVTFRSHERTVKLPGSEEPVRICVGPKEIDEIVKNNRELEQQGYFPRLTDGHVQQKPDFPEPQQPPLIGFMSNPRLGDFLGEPCVMFDYHVRHKHSHLLSERPNRSAEYAYTRNVIRGASMLVRDPFLDMGTLYYSLHSDPVYLYGVSSMPNDDKKKDDAATMNGDGKKTALTDSIVSQVVEAMLAKFPGLAALAGPPATPNAPPSGTAPATMPMPNAAAPYQSQGELLLYQQVQALQKTIGELTTVNDSNECVQMVNALVVARYDLDATYEFGIVQSLPKEKRQGYVENLRRRSKQLPGATPIPVLQGNMDYSKLPTDPVKVSREGTMNRAEFVRVMDYVSEHGGTVEEAMAKVLAS